MTHSLSAAMFVAILAPVVLFILLWPKAMGTQRKNCALLDSSSCFRRNPCFAFPNSGNPHLFGAVWLVEIDNAAFSRILAYWIVVPLFGIVAAFFAFSTKYYKKLLAVPTFLLAMWVFVPLVCTQGYLGWRSS